tara:strand:+ start:215 stop:322 length:108 start_codon:yes stop_codon:yes gene_type:complete
MENPIPIIVLIILIGYLIYNRSIETKDENFEDRDN